MEDEKDDKSQEGINKASRGGLVYGDYLQVSLRVACLSPWSLLTLEPGPVINASPSSQPVPKTGPQEPFVYLSSPCLFMGTGVCLNWDGTGRLRDGFSNCREAGYFGGFRRELFILVNLKCEVVHHKRLSLV